MFIVSLLLCLVIVHIESFDRPSEQKYFVHISRVFGISTAEILMFYLNLEVPLWFSLSARGCWSWMELDLLSSLDKSSDVSPRRAGSLVFHSTVGTLYTFNKDKVAQRGSSATGEVRNHWSYV